MKRTTALSLAFLLTGGFLVSSCSAAQEPFARAAQAESGSNFAEARTLYGEVCAKAADSPLCPIAKKRAARLVIKEAEKAVDDGQLAKAKELITSASASGEAGVKQAAEALQRSAEVTAGLAFEEASAGADKAVARVKMEELAEQHTAVAPKAREWLAKNSPALLLVELKAACQPDGKGSCLELGKRMASGYGQSPEAAEAAKLVEAEYTRAQPLLKQAENLLIQRLEIYNKEKKFNLCLQEVEPAPGSVVVHLCASEVGVEPRETGMFSTSFLDKAWDKKLEEIHDPGHIKRFKERYQVIADRGEYDPEPWPKPGEASK
jgi:hypothetical protein